MISQITPPKRKDILRVSPCGKYTELVSEERQVLIDREPIKYIPDEAN